MLLKFKTHLSRTLSDTISFSFLIFIIRIFKMNYFKYTENKAPVCSHFPNIMNVITLSYFLQMSF